MSAWVNELLAPFLISIQVGSLGNRDEYKQTQLSVIQSTKKHQKHKPFKQQADNWKSITETSVQDAIFIFDKNKFSRSVYRQYSVQGEAFEGELNGREQNLDPSVVVLFCKELKEKKK